MNIGLKFAARVWMYYAIALVVCIMFLLGGGTIQIILNIALFAGIVLLCINEGGYRGEKACTLAASLEKQQKDGRRIDPLQSKQVWNRKVAAQMVVFCVIPLWLIAAINVAVVPVLDQAALTEEEIALQNDPFAIPDDAESDDTQSLTQSQTIIKMVTRVLFMPFVCVYGLVSETVLNWLLFLFALPFPIAAYAGYMMGPKLREKKLKDMMKGKRRKQRNLKVNKQPRKPKAEV